MVASITGCQPVADNARDIGPSPATLTTVGGRDVDIRVWWPGRACDPCDAIVFSHGNNLAFDQYDEILEPWAEAYAAAVWESEEVREWRAAAEAETAVEAEYDL